MDLSAVTKQGVVRPTRVSGRGQPGLTPQQARGSGWRRTSRGFYVPAAVDRTPEQKILEAAAALPGELAAITGWAALRWMWGGDFDYWSDRPVVVALLRDRHIRPQPPLLEVSAEQWRPGDHIYAEGLPVTVPERSALFEARYADDVVEAVRILDAALATDLVSIEELVSYSERLAAWTGIPQAREAISLANENVWSPMETEMRLRWVQDLAIGNLVANHPVFDRSGRFIGTPDLLDLDAGMVGEYDGAVHLGGRQRARDLTREAAFRQLGLEYVTMTARDRVNIVAYERRVRQARARAAWASPDRRRWTVQPPRNWVPTTTVAQRRSLTPGQRARLLRRRGG